MPVPTFEGKVFDVAVPLALVLDVVAIEPVEIEKYVVLPVAPLGVVAENDVLKVEYPAIA